MTKTGISCKIVKMIDNFGRHINYIRISVTDRCNLRCKYCMPHNGIDLTSHKEILRFEEIAYLCEIFAHLGIENVKITGGEPLAVKELPSLVKKIKFIPGIKTVTLTTNGTMLTEKLDSLIEAGIDGINISLDTLDEKKFLDLTGFPFLDKTLAAIRASVEKDIATKINTVVLRNFNEGEVCQIASLARDNKVDVRFIELMPIGLGKIYESVPQDEVEVALENKFGPLTENPCGRGNGPATYYTLPNFKGNIGFISSKSHKFCDCCNRIRLTGDGFLKQCLHFDGGTDLKTPLRQQVSREELTALVASCIAEKPEGHRFGEDVSHGEKRIMAKIGG